MRHGTTLWCRDNEGKTPLYVAVQNNEAKLVCDLLNSIPLDELHKYLKLGESKENETVLVLAARLGFTRIIEILLSVLPPDKRFEYVVGTRTEYGEFALFKAVEYNKVDVVKKMLSMVPEELRISALTACCWNKNVIHRAAENGDFKMLQTLLLFIREEQRVHVINIPVSGCLAYDDEGMTALHLAVKSKNMHASQIITFLVAHGADLTIRDGKGNTPFDLAETDEMRDLLHY